MTAPAYTPLHPQLYRYDPGFLDPALRTGERLPAYREVAEQIYLFKLFTDEFCRLLIEEAEHSARWRTEADVEDNPYAEGVDEVCEPDTTQHLERMGGLDRVYDEVVRQHLQPFMEGMWRTFKLKKVSRPYILKYSADAIRDMKMHHDLETLTLVCYLNTEFEGGGTHFPRWSYTTGKQAPGTAILYPGGLSHEHEGLAITSGRRYLLCGSYY